MSELPRGWVAAKLPTVCTKITDGTHHSPVNLPTGDFPYITAKNIRKWGLDLTSITYVDEATHREIYSRCAPEKGDILYIKDGATTGLAVVNPLEEPFSMLSSVALIKPDRNALEPEYLRNWLNSPNTLESMLGKMTGTAIRRLTLTTISAQEIPIPPLPEQRRIVRKLDALSTRTSAARAQLAAVENLVPRYKLAVLRSAFAGRLTKEFRDHAMLEPVSTLLRRTPIPQQGRGGRQATTEVKKGRGGISVNIPEVSLPNKWEWVPLLRVARQETGHTPSRSRDDWWGGNVCWISIPDANLHHGRVILDTIQKTNDEGLANSSARLLPAGTVVLSRTASVGYICIMGREMATSQDFATWTCTDALLPEYLMYALLSEGEDIKKFGEGSTHTTIYFPEIRAFHIKLAPLDEQREIVRRIATAFARIDRLALEAAKALKLTDQLDHRILSKAFAGELVPQDPSDEPAETLLARIREQRGSTSKTRTRRAKR